MAPPLVKPVLGSLLLLRLKRVQEHSSPVNMGVHDIVDGQAGGRPRATLASSAATRSLASAAVAAGALASSSSSSLAPRASRASFKLLVA